MPQFSNTDAPKKPQKLHIRWEMKFIPEEHSDRPDENDDGFWPSRNPKDAGYIGARSKAEFDRQMASAKQRMADWEAGEWFYGGVVAVAHLLIPIGGGSFRIMTLESAGLWGIESDSEDYHKDVFEQEKSNLLAELTKLCEALASGDFIQEGEGVE